MSRANRCSFGIPGTEDTCGGANVPLPIASMTSCRNAPSWLSTTRSRALPVTVDVGDHHTSQDLPRPQKRARASERSIANARVITDRARIARVAEVTHDEITQAISV